MRTLSMPISIVVIRGRQSPSRPPRPSPVKRAADKHSASDEIDDDNNDDESSDDESSDSGASFDDLGNVPHKSSASFSKQLYGFGGAAPNHVLVQRDDWADDGGLGDNDTDGTLVDGEHDDQRDPNAVHADPSTPPAKPNRPPPPVEALDTASPPSRYLLARELQAQDDWADDGGLGDNDTDDADTLKTRPWSSLWHDVLYDGGGEGGGADGIDELDVDTSTAQSMVGCAARLSNGGAPSRQTPPRLSNGAGGGYRHRNCCHDKATSACTRWYACWRDAHESRSGFENIDLHMYFSSQRATKTHKNTKKTKKAPNLFVSIPIPPRGE